MCKVKKTISLSSHILDKAEEERKRLGLDLSGYISVLIATGNVNNGTPQYILPIGATEPLSTTDDESEYDEEEDEEKRNRIEAMMNMDFGDDDEEE